jgi:hypothetical protein
MKPKKSRSKRLKYDSTWKEIAEEFLPDFIEMFLPELYPKIDFTIEPVPLEKELFGDTKDSSLREADSIVKVIMKVGPPEIVVIHTEFESSSRLDIGARMYQYFTLIRSKYDYEVNSFVIYTGSTVPKIHDHYQLKSHINELNFKFKSYIVRDQIEKDLIDNPNPLAIFVLANLYILQTKNDEEQRFAYKREVYKIAISRNYDAAKIKKLLIFVGGFMKLNPKFESKFKELENKTTTKPHMKLTKERIPYFDMVYGPIHEGLTLSDVLEERSSLKKTIKQKDQDYKKIIRDLKQKDQSLKQKDQSLKQQELAIQNAIINLYKTQNLQAAQIAEILALDIEYVAGVLDAKKIQ